MVLFLDQIRAFQYNINVFFQSFQTNAKKYNFQDDDIKLIEAITKRQHDVVFKLVAGRVNQPMDDLLNKTASGPPLLLAIHDLNTTLVKILITEFGADVNQEIFILGKKSTLFIYIIRCLTG